MNLNGALYGGISGAEIRDQSFELGEGLTLRRIIAQLWAPWFISFPLLLGFPPENTREVRAGVKPMAIQLQLDVPVEFTHPENVTDRAMTIWWITALIRLRGLCHVHAAAIAERPFYDIRDDPANTATIMPIEVLPRRFRSTTRYALTQDDLEWLKGTWRPAAVLLKQHPKLSDAFQAFDSIGGTRSDAVALLTLWGALEHLFSPAKQELSFRVSAYIAAFLEPFGPERLALQQQLAKLYTKRSGAAHGPISMGERRSNAWELTYDVMARVLLKIFANNAVPTRTDLEQLLFGA